MTMDIPWAYRHAILGIEERFPFARPWSSMGWAVVRRWEQEEPGSCRVCPPPALIKAMMGVALLWNWPNFAMLLGLAMSGMLHTFEFLDADRVSLLLPSNRLERGGGAFLSVGKPKTTGR